MAQIREGLLSPHKVRTSVLRSFLTVALAFVVIAGSAALPASASTASGITEYKIPTASSKACGIAMDEQHNDMWFTEGVGKLGSIDTDGNCTELRKDDFSISGTPSQIVVDDVGCRWFTENDTNKIGWYWIGGSNLGGEVQLPGANAGPSGITAGPNGSAWFTEKTANKIGLCNMNKVVKEYGVPTAASEPLYLVQDHNKNVWFTESSTNRLGVLFSGAVAIVDFEVPTPDSGPAGITIGAYCRVWFAERNANKLAWATDPRKIHEVKLPPGGGGPSELTLGPDGNIWYTRPGADRVGFCTSSGHVVEYSLHAGSKPMGITAGPDASVWFVEQGTNKIARAPVAFSTWYLAEGTTSWGFSTYISVQNPNATAATVRLTYETPRGRVRGPALTLPGMSQATINPSDTLGEQDFSTRVTCDDPTQTIAVDRTMVWTGAGASSEEGHSSVGVTETANRWYFAEGSSAWGFESWLLIHNPEDTDTRCFITYLVEGKRAVTVAKTVPAHSRRSFSMADDIGAADASMVVDAQRPVIAERAMYRNNRREGHDSIGTTEPALRYYLAEGTTASGFTTYVLVENPGTSPTQVHMSFMTTNGRREIDPFDLAGQSRKTICINDLLPGSDFSIIVEAGYRGFKTQIVVDRAMFWDNGTGQACHGSIGMSMPHRTFYFPDGQTSNGRETWILVQNTNNTDVKVQLTYMTPTGKGNVSFIETIPANSRRSFNLADKLPCTRASIMVKCTSPKKKIMSERAMYWNNRGAGTDTIGVFSD